MLTDGFFVYNLAHQEQCIRGKHGSLRILGCFSTREEAEAFVYEWTLEQPDLETRVSPMNQWRVLSKTLWDLETQKQAFVERWAAYLKEREDEFRDVEHRATHKIAGPVKVAEPPRVDTESTQSAKQNETTQIANSIVPRVPKKLEVIGQKQIGIALLPDHGSFNDQEPFFQVLGVADNEKELEDFLKKHSNEQVDALGLQSSVPLASVVMQEFVPLAKLSTVRTRRQSPNEHLEAIRQNFSFENKDGGLDDSGVAGVAPCPA